MFAPALNCVGEPKEIELSEESTVPTMPLPRPESPLSWKSITILLLLVSKTQSTLAVPPASKVTILPKLIEVPETVPTTALPLSESPLSTYAITT